MFTNREKLIIQRAVMEMRQNLTNYKTWLKDEKNNPLPKTEVAIDQIEKEIVEYLNLQLKIYELWKDELK